MASCCPNNASNLKHRLDIEALVRAEDGQGGFTESWVIVGSLWAGIEPMKGYERYQAMQMQVPVSHKIVTRYRSDLTTKNRFRKGERVFAIKELLNEGEENLWLNIRALEMA